jgi:hypothetical protein
LEIEIEIPVGASAVVCLPGRVSAIRENGQLPAGVSGVTAARDTPEGAMLTVGSGRYRFDTAQG